MSRDIYVSTNCFRDRSPEGIFRVAVEEGWTRIELSAVQASTAESIALARSLRNEGVAIFLHNYFPPPAVPFVLNLASSDPDVRNRSREHCESAIELSSELGASLFAAHAGFAVDLPAALLGNPAEQRQFLESGGEAANPGEAWAIFTESVGRLTEFGRRNGVRFLVENHVAGGALGAAAARKFLLALDAEAFAALAATVGSDFGMLLDVGHLHCTARTMGFSENEFCERVAPWVRAFHLSANGGERDDHEAFDESAWFLDVVRAHPGCPATLEFERCAPGAVAASRRVIEKL